LININHRRSELRFYTKIGTSFPFIDVDLKLTSRQVAMLMNGPKYILPCQSRFSRTSIDELVTSDYERLSTTVKKCLSNNCMSASDNRAQVAFGELKQMMTDLYSKPLSRKLHLRAQREHRQVKHLQKLLRSRPDITICRIDKNPAFYVGRVATIAAKALEYMTTTEAYQEIRDDRCPLADNLHAVRTLLDYLVSRKAITVKQKDKLLPNVNQLELAHFHGLPKVHKVRLSLFLRCSYTSLCYCPSYIYSLICHCDRSLLEYMHQRH
jgi:hypothetical protein